MTVYDSNRILTVRELRRNDTLHSGMLAGMCVRWTVVEIHYQYAFIKLGDSIVRMTGHDLRDWPFYLAEKCPNCALQSPVKPTEIHELYRVAAIHLEAADVSSKFRFKQAQFIKGRR